MKQLRITLLFIIFLFLSINTFGAGNPKVIPQLNTVGNNIESFIPNDWKLIAQAEGDLNQDKLADIAGVIEYCGTETSDEQKYSRILFIAFQNEEQNYDLSIQTEKAIKGASNAETFEDPLAGISADRGSLEIQLYGVSRRYYIYRFQYLDNDWYLIGTTISGYNNFAGAQEEKDINFLNGKSILTVTDQNNKKKVYKSNLGHKKLLNLQDFDIYLLEDSF
jgi:hypothetical protein